MLPRLLMPYSFAWPPVECCRGTRPSQAANSRPLLNAAPLPIAATVAVETSGPIPGICRALAGFIFVGDAFDFLADNGCHSPAASTPAISDRAACASEELFFSQP